MSEGHVGNPGYFAERLPRALAVVERQGRKLHVGEGMETEAIETIAALVDHSLRQITAPGVEFAYLPGGRASGPGGSIGIDVDDDQSMIAHINNGLASGVFAAPAPGREGRAGSPVASSQIPLEDRGKTSYVVGPGADPNVVVPGSDPLPPIPGLSPAIMQWLPVAMWGARQLVKLIQQWRNR